MNIKRLQDLASYRGLRHRRGLPVRRPAHPHQRPYPQGVRPSRSPARRSKDKPQAMAKEPTRVKKRERKNITSGVAHVNASFNNTMITITDAQGNTISWSSSGTMGFKGSRKSTPYAAQVAAEDAGRKAMEHGVKDAGSERGWPRVRPRIGAAGASGRGLLHHRYPRRDADPAQRLPSAQAPPGLTPAR